LFDSENVMRFVAWRGLSDGYRRAVEGHSPWTRGTEKPDPIYVNDVAVAYLEDALKRTVQSEGIGALGFIPLIADGRLIGKFMTYYNEPHLFRQTEIDLALTIGRQLAFAIQRQRSEEMLRESERPTTADLKAAMRLYDIGKQCTDVSARFEECLQAILDGAIGIMGAAKGNIQLLNPESGTLNIAVYRGFDRPFLKFFSTVDANHAAACGRAMRKMERVIIENIEQSEVFAGKESLSVLLEAGVHAVQSTPLCSSAGRILGIISTHFNAPHRPSDRELRFMDLLARQAADYLERKRVEEALQIAKAQAEEASQAKDQFLAMLSHELRTPLTPVLMAATALETDSNVSHEMREQLAMMRRNIELEARLIDDLLDITRITHGKLELHEELVDVHAALDHALKISESGALTKELHIRKNFGAAEHYSRADAARLQEVFWNVLRNAVKFTAAGGQIDISTHNEKETIVVEISDNGIGIDPEIQPRIFDAFAQGEPAIRARFGGLGLGLAISKRIIDLHRERLPCEARVAIKAPRLSSNWHSRPDRLQRLRIVRQSNWHRSVRRKFSLSKIMKTPCGFLAKS